MQNQKFYIIFLVFLFFIFIYAVRYVEIPNANKTENQLSDVNFLEQAQMQRANIGIERGSGNYNKFDSIPDVAVDTDFVNVNMPVPLSGKSKNEIYKIRKSYVISSIFANTKYEPSERVFGQIVSGKPWISANVCAEPNTGLLGISGPSEESRFINNPTMLVAIEYPFIVRYNNDICTRSTSQLIPRKIAYTPSRKEITVVYYHLPFTTNNNSSFYTFNGLNAVDFGYKYAYIDNSKSSYVVDFINSSNLSNGVHEFQNFIHLGGSCGHSGGCNNGSPRQGFAEFKSNATKYNYENREIYIKLWKSRPNSPADKPDMVERIILRWS